MFSQTTEYALRATVILAGNPEKLLTTAELASTTQVPAGYLSKVLQNLTKTGLVSAARGLRGGYQLARPASEISVLDVINAVEPLGRIHACPLGLPEHQKLCPLHQQIDDAIAIIEQRLASKSLAEMIDPARAGFTSSDPSNLLQHSLSSPMGATK